MGSAVGAIIGAAGTITGSLIGAKASKEAGKEVGKAADAAAQAQLEMYYQSREDLAPWMEAGKWALGKPEMPQVELDALQTKRDSLQTELDSLKQKQQSPERPVSRFGLGRDETGRIEKYGTRSFLDRDIPSVKPVDYSSRIADLEAQIAELDSQIATGASGAAGTGGSTGLIGLIERGPGEFIPSEQPGYKFGYKEFIEKPIMRQASARGRLRSPATQKALTRYAEDYASREYDNFLSRYYQSLTPYQSLAGVGQTAATTTGNWGIGTGAGVAQNYLTGGLAQGQADVMRANALMGGVSGLTNILSNYWANKNPNMNYTALTPRQKLLGV